MKNTKKTLLYFIIILLVAAGGYYGFKLLKYSQNHVETDNAQISGNIVPISSRIPGYISSIYVKENQYVHKGDKLVQMDTSDLQLKLMEAEVALHMAEANYKAAQTSAQATQAGVKSTQISRDAAQVRLRKAKEDFERRKALHDQNIGTTQEYENFKTAVSLAEEELLAAEAQITNANEHYLAAAEQVKVAQTSIERQKVTIAQLQHELTYGTIYAPVDGIVSKLNVEQGQLISQGQPLFAVVDNNNIWVQANFKETQLTDLKEGQKVEVTVDAYPGKVYEGRVESFAGATGARFSLLPPDNASGNFVKVVQRMTVRISLPHTKEIMEQLKPGLSANVSVSTKS